MPRYQDKVVVVTGAGHGIGRAIALHLGTEGASVAIIEINDAIGKETLALLENHGVKACFNHADITKPDEMKSAIAEINGKLGPIDLLVNNAAFTDSGNLEQISDEEWIREIDINLNGTYHATHAVLPQMVERKQGAIVIISSVNGLRYFGNPAYSAAKAGSINLAKSLASEYGKYGIRTNAVCPGSVRTDAASWKLRLERDPQVFEKLARWYPLGRVAVPEDIAKAVAYLGSDDASYINGVVLPVDGGLTAGMNVMIEELTIETEGF